jgi:hypothetical protein
MVGVEKMTIIDIKYDLTNRLLNRLTNNLPSACLTAWGGINESLLPYIESTFLYYFSMFIY